MAQESQTPVSSTGPLMITQLPQPGFDSSPVKNPQPPQAFEGSADTLE